MKINSAFWAILFAAIPWIFPPAAAANSCEGLTALTLPDTTVTLAKSVAAGALSLPGVSVQGSPAALTTVAIKDLPAFCRVAITIKPSQDSDIKVEVWMPAANWNGKFMAIGNGGWAGSISYGVMAAPLARGYATASTDTGHEGTAMDGSFTLGHPEKLIDFGYRAVHEMTAKAKAIIAAYYGEAPKHSYWNGCSSGGRQGLKEAQRYPADYDGIVAGAPANSWVRLSAQSIWVGQVVHKDEASYIPPSKYPAIHSAVLEACDTLDGVKDGVLENPMRCRFNPKVLECKGPDGPACLTAPQVQAVQEIYAPATNPRTGEEIYPGLMPGSELGWAAMAGPQPNPVSVAYFAYVVFKNQNWDYKTLNLDSDVATAERIDDGTIVATDPDLKPFFARGGKLLQYHGWGDNQIAPLSSVNYYETVVKEMGGVSKVNDSYRLFMIPGMSHCRGGEGLNNFDSISILEQWVEKGKVPEQVTASRVQDGQVVRTRPLCPYPQVAAYKGTGSTDDAKNFVCRVEPGTVRDGQSARPQASK
jgi:feruloyl esterase